MFSSIKRRLFKNYVPSAQRDIGFSARRNYILGGIFALGWVVFISANIAGFAFFDNQDIAQKEQAPKVATEQKTYEPYKETPEGLFENYEVYKETPVISFESLEDATEQKAQKEKPDIFEEEPDLLFQ